MEDGDGPLAADLLQIKALFANHHLSDVLFVFSSDSGAAAVRRVDDLNDDPDDAGGRDAEAESEHHLLPAHRLVLALRSGAFHEALLRSRSSHVPSQVRFPLKIYIQDTSYRVFFTLLRFLYTNQVTESTEKTEDDMIEFWKQLLRAAFIYAVPALVDICAAHLVKLLQLAVEASTDRDGGAVGADAQDEPSQTQVDADGDKQSSTAQLRQVFGLLVFSDRMLALHPPSARRRTSNKRASTEKEGAEPTSSSAESEEAASNTPEQALESSNEVRGLEQSMRSVENLQSLCVLRLKTVSDRQFEVLLHTDTGKQCSTERICELLKQRSDTPLVVAIRYQLGRVVNELLCLGEPLESINHDESDLPLVAALKTGNDAIIRRLLVDENAPFFYLDKIPLFLLACSSGNVLQCEILIDRVNADVNLISELQDADKDIVAEFGRQQTPLHIASRKGHSAVVELLLKHKAASNLPDADGNTPLHCAANMETVQVLLSDSFKTNANIPNRRGRTPLHVAAARGDVNVVDYLLRHGAQQDILDDQGQNAFHHAAANGHTAVALVLLHDSESFNPHAVSRKALSDASGTPSATLDGNSVEGMTDSQEGGVEGFDINMADLKGNTALHLAAMSPSDRCQKMLQLLLENGADPNCANWFGYTPLHLFCAHQSGPASVVDVFVRAA